MTELLAIVRNAYEAARRGGAQHGAALESAVAAFRAVSPGATADDAAAAIWAALDDEERRAA